MTESAVAPTALLIWGLMEYAYPWAAWPDVAGMSMRHRFNVPSTQFLEGHVGAFVFQPLC